MEWHFGDNDKNSCDDRVTPHIQGILDTLPDKPGCYIYKNRSRPGDLCWQSHQPAQPGAFVFPRQRRPGHKTRQLVRSIANIEWIVVGSELEALILEMNLIKKHRPHFNIRLKDDKRYPYIKVHGRDAVPQSDRHPPDDQRRLPVFWPLHQRLGSPPDPGCAAPDFPLPDL